MKFKVRTVSPIHVGDGSQYTPLEYLVHEKRFHYLPYERVAAALTPAQRQAWLAYLEKERQPSLSAFAADNKLAATIAGQACYSMACTQPGTMRDLRAFIKTGGQAYLPGSEMKGALRTAVLYQMLGEEREYMWLAEQIRQVDRESKNLQDYAKREKRQLHERLEERLQLRLLCPPQTDWRRGPNYDLLRFLQIPDSGPIDTDARTMFIGAVNIYNGGREITAYAECVDAGIEFDFARFGPEPNFAGDPNVRKLNYLPKQLEALRPNNLLAACHQFSRDLLAAHKEYFGHRRDRKGAQINDSDLLAGLQTLENLNEPASPLLAIGAYGGFFHTTVMLRVKHKNPELIENTVRYWTSGKHYDNFPKTCRDVQRGGQRLPIGWVKLCPQQA